MTTQTTTDVITANTIGRQHIGRTLTADIRTDDGTEQVTGILRWITHTSDTVVLALEEGEDAGAEEWELALDQAVSAR